MTTIAYPLSNGGETRIDEADLPLLVGRSWRRIDVRRYGRAYVASDTTAAGRTVRTYLHRLLMGVHAGSRPLVDHLDGDGLNNTRANLRLATPAQNSQNTPSRGRYRGVFRQGGAYIARAGSHYAGTFQTEVLAALAYDDLAVKKWGEQSRLNFPPVSDPFINARFSRCV